jgi:hypothetical protein
MAERRSERLVFWSIIMSGSGVFDLRVSRL